MGDSVSPLPTTLPVKSPNGGGQLLVLIFSRKFDFFKIGFSKGEGVVFKSSKFKKNFYILLLILKIFNIFI
jgi:hypothetical protein